MKTARAVPSSYLIGCEGLALAVIFGEYRFANYVSGRSAHSAAQNQRCPRLLRPAPCHVVLKNPDVLFPEPLAQFEHDRCVLFGWHSDRQCHQRLAVPFFKALAGEGFEPSTFGL
jgi:hypothetical protein